jgi:biotin carboxyl carrier protein
VTAPLDPEDGRAVDRPWDRGSEAGGDPPHEDSSADPTDVGIIARLADEIVPALAAKLTATGLGELEVRQGGWKIRIRRPDSDPGRYGRRATDRPSRAQPGHAGHGHAPAAVEGHRARAAGAFSGNGSQPPDMTPVGPGHAPEKPLSDEADDPYRGVATSPAVGVFQPGPTAQAGSRVYAGDRLGVVDMLGVPQEVVAPVDGIVGATLVEAGQAVEYGQELIVVEQVERADRVP